MIVIQRTHEICDVLKRDLDRCTLKWKGGEETDVYKEEKPTVYEFVFDDISNDLPLKTPSILVQFTGLRDNTASYIVYVCVCNPALQDKELTVSEDGGQTFYYIDGKKIDTAGVRLELYKATLMLAEVIYTSISRLGMNAGGIYNVELTPPSPYLDRFPYCEATVSFEAACPQSQAVPRNNTEVTKYL